MPQSVKISAIEIGENRLNLELHLEEFMARVQIPHKKLSVKLFHNDNYLFPFLQNLDCSALISWINIVKTISMVNTIG